MIDKLNIEDITAFASTTLDTNETVDDFNVDVTEQSLKLITEKVNELVEMMNELNNPCDHMSDNVCDYCEPKTK